MELLNLTVSKDQSLLKVLEELKEKKKDAQIFLHRSYLNKIDNNLISYSFRKNTEFDFFNVTDAGNLMLHWSCAEYALISKGKINSDWHEILSVCCSGNLGFTKSKDPKYLIKIKMDE